MSTRPVVFPVSCEAAYDYLVAPGNRAEWQSSLKGVADVVGKDGVAGQSWTDLTSAGLKPRMELTDADRPHRWSERGTWGRFHAVLTLTFTPDTAAPTRRCHVAASMEVGASGWAAPIGMIADRIAPIAVRDDLRRAARLLGARPLDV